MLARSTRSLVSLLVLAIGCAPATPVAPTVTLLPAASGLPSASSSPGRAPTPTSDAFTPQPDVVADDPSLPAGAVQVTVVDADGEPIARAPITLESVLIPEMADGLDVLAKDTAVADDRGVALFRKRRMDAGVHQLASTSRGDGVFSATPFVLDPKAGKRVRLHAYETVSSLENAMVGMQVLIALTVRADRIAVEQVFTVFNLGRTAWVPSSVRVAFPPNVTGFSVHDLGNPLRADAITADGFALIGTVAPGKSELSFSYAIPRDPTGAQQLHLALPPRSAQARVILDASGPATLSVAGFPEAVAEAYRDATLLVTDKMGERAQGGLKAVDVTFAGDPR